MITVALLFMHFVVASGRCARARLRTRSAERIVSAASPVIVLVGLRRALPRLEVRRGRSCRLLWGAMHLAIIAHHLPGNITFN